jgi:serine/threonine protein kinase
VFKEQSLRGNYDIIGVLAQGPHSILYHGKARDAEQTEVAIKVWPTARVTTKSQRERIQQEIQALVALEHLHILPIVAFTIEDLGISIIREYAPKGSLQARLMRNFLKPLPFDKAFTIITQAGQALHAAHQQNITHGDLTPYNILFTAQNNVVLSDFHIPGILAAIEDYTGEAAPLRWYMAPEQFQGTINAQSDQYALGCLAYQLFTGSVPFSGIARHTLQQRHTVEIPTELTMLNRALPARIERAVLKALAKDPKERYTDIQAFLEALDGSGQLVRQLTTPVLKSLPRTNERTSLNNVTPQQEEADAGFTLEQPVNPIGQSQQPTPHKKKSKAPQIALLLVLIALVVATADVYRVIAPISSIGHNPGIVAFTNIVQTPLSLFSPSHSPTTTSPSGTTLTQVPTKAPTPTLTPTPAATPTVRPSPTATTKAARPSPTLTQRKQG